MCIRDRLNPSATALTREVDLLVDYKKEFGEAVSDRLPRDLAPSNNNSKVELKAADPEFEKWVHRKFRNNATVGPKLVLAIFHTNAPIDQIKQDLGLSNNIYAQLKRALSHNMEIPEAWIERGHHSYDDASRDRIREHLVKKYEAECAVTFEAGKDSASEASAVVSKAIVEELLSLDNEARIIAAQKPTKPESSNDIDEKSVPSAESQPDADNSIPVSKKSENTVKQGISKISAAGAKLDDLRDKLALLFNGTVLDEVIDMSGMTFEVTRNAYTGEEQLHVKLPVNG